MTIAILVAGLWPFNFWARNKVEWLKGENGVRFFGQGIIYSEQIIPEPKRGLFLEWPISIEIWLEAQSEPNSHLSRIFSLYDAKDSEISFLAQWESTLILRTKVFQPNGRSIYKEVGVEKALSKGLRRFITITSAEKGTHIYLDGKLEQIFPYYSFIPKNATTLSQIILGNSPAGKNYWAGNVYALAIYNGSLSSDRVSQNFQNWKKRNFPLLLEESKPLAFFPFAEGYGTKIHDPINLSILFAPPKITFHGKMFLVHPWQDFRFNLSYFNDIASNILGFIPFAFLLSVY